MEPESILNRAISPASAVALLLSKGIQISERALRERAREIGAYRQIGRAIFFTPEDLEKIAEPVAVASLQKPTSTRHGTRYVRSEKSDLEEARAKLQSLKRERRQKST